MDGIYCHYNDIVLSAGLVLICNRKSKYFIPLFIHTMTLILTFLSVKIAIANRKALNYMLL